MINNYSKNKHCSCRKSITNNAIFCKKCANLDERAYNYKGGKEARKKFCIDCNKQLSESAFYNNSVRCNSCEMARKWLDKELKPRCGKKSASWIDGRTLKTYFCIDCGKKISYIAGSTGKGRCKSCSKKGKLHPFWKGGLDLYKYPSEFNIKLKNQIRQRDNYTCQKCHTNEIKASKIFKRKLHVHHIDYNKDNCNENNLITLCANCNLEVNGNRDYWFAYFNYLLQ